MSARSSQVSIQLNVVSGYINAAQGYATEIQSKIGIANGYLAEAKARLAIDGQKYNWYQSQQGKLQQEYDKGMQLLVSKAVPPQLGVS